MSSHKHIVVAACKFSLPLLLFYSIFTFLLSGCSDGNAENKDEKEFSELNKLFDLAAKKADAGNVAGCLKFIDSAVANKKLNVRQRFKVIAYKTGVYYHSKDSSNAMIFADSLLNLVEQNGKDKYKEEYALANYSIGDVLFLEKKYSEAYKYYFMARSTGETELDMCTLAEYNYRIGMVLFQQSRFIEAADNFKEAFKQSQNCTIDFSRYYRRQEILNNIALSFQRSKNYDSAIVYYNNALQFIRQYDGVFKNKEHFNEIARGVIYGNEGQIFKDLGQLEKAEEWLKKSIAINTKKGYDNKDAQLNQLKLAEVYLISNRIDSMSTLLTQLRQSLDTIPNKQAEIEWNRLMWKYSESKQIVGKAYQYLDRFTVMSDSAQKVKNKLASYDVGQQIKVLEDQYRINSLEKENKLKNLYLLIFFVATLLGIAILLFSLYILRNTKRNYEVLKSLNNKIEDQKIELKQTLLQLEKRNKEKDTILRVVAHDLRTPAASISMLTDLIFSEDDHNKKDELLKLIKSSGDNLLSLISEILEATELENNSSLPKQKNEVNKLLNEAVAPLRYKASEKQQTIHLENLEEDANVFVNKEKIVRVVTNLITNAIKFSKAKTEIRVKSAQKGSSILISVQDQGIGIPDHLKTKVFDMFTEAKRSGTLGEKPFGLGLSICKQIIEAHGGKIWFESELGKGSTFFIELEAKPVFSKVLLTT